MALSSSTFVLRDGTDGNTKAKESGLLTRHHKAVQKVVSEAKTFSDERKRNLDRITDKGLRQSAAR